MSKLYQQFHLHATDLDLDGDLFEIILCILPVVIVVLFQRRTVGMDEVPELVQLLLPQSLLLRLDE